MHLLLLSIPYPPNAFCTLWLPDLNYKQDYYINLFYLFSLSNKMIRPSNTCPHLFPRLILHHLPSLSLSLWVPAVQTFPLLKCVRKQNLNNFPLLLLHFNSLTYRSQIQCHFLKKFFFPPRQDQAHVLFPAIACYTSSENSTAFIIYLVSIFPAILEVPRGRYSYFIFCTHHCIPRTPFRAWNIINTCEMNE